MSAVNARPRRHARYVMLIISATSTTAAARASIRPRTSSRVQLLRGFASTSGNVRRPPIRTTKVEQQTSLTYQRRSNL